MKITLLGTGTPAPSLERQSSGYLIEVGSDVLLMDHGPGSHHRLLESGRRAIDITHVFFSHLHYDHCVEYSRLVLQRWDQGADRIADLQVFGPSPIARMTEQLFGEEGVFGADIRARREHQSSIDVFRARGWKQHRRRPEPQVREIAAGDRVEGKGWSLRAGHAQHVQPYLECLAYRLESAAGSLCYSGDSGYCEELIELARGCDLLIMMNHHLSGSEPSEAYRRACGNHVDNALLAERAGVKAMVLTHLLAQIDRPGIRELITHEIQERFSGQVIWGEDLMELELPLEGSAGIE